jgi:hypothetical protein
LINYGLEITIALEELASFSPLLLLI